MKKTLTVNLNGTVFNIDEDAYQLLDKYLANLRIHFKKEEGSEEILNDFESRISELLNEKIRLGYSVITIEQVEEVITRMGKPEEIFEEEETQTTENGKTKTTTYTEVRETSRRRFFRNPDDKILGGVASGFAAYMGWDPTLVRIGLLLLLFFTNIVIIPIYLVLWIVIPVAKTAAEKLEMRGESVTLESIGKTVTDGFEKVSSDVDNVVKSEKSRNSLQKLADVFVQVMGIILKLIGIIIAVLLTPVLLFVLFILVVLIFALVFGGAGILYSFLPAVNWAMMPTHPEYAIVLGSIGAILAIGIPVGAILYSLFGQWLHFKPVSQGVKWAFLLLWIIGLVMCIVFQTHYNFPLWNYWGNHSGIW
ncbi:PspC domain-containing protein [Parabacteroides pacaensis]|uniref:PspC domain-containing protein n=1 Tax=Parabacteroides pacaensis TaxID=2086575 RepID=UPI000D1061AC|nr:PspC domain-containing protein [Parabacteroides pacaensis]